MEKIVRPFFPSFLPPEDERRRLAQQAEVLRAHNAELLSLIDEAARERHDHRHQLCALYSFLSGGETKRAIEYLENLIPATGWQDCTVFCCNPIIDAFLQYYKNLCLDKGIAFTSSVRVPPHLPISDTELSALCGNLLENAWEACIRQKSISPYINVQGKCKGAEFLFRIENSFDSPAVVKRGHLVSSKTGGCGTGTRSVRAIVERYGGSVIFEPDGHVFRASVILPLESGISH